MNRSRAQMAAALVLIALGATAISAGWRHRYAPPPQPPPPAGPSRPVAAATGQPPALPPAAPEVRTPGPLGYSIPVSLDVPAIGVRARIIPLGESADGSVAVPPLSQPFLTSWFDEGPAPGQRGPAAVFGHVDSAQTGPAVFYKLGDLQPGDVVSITREDHWVAVFRVYLITVVPKADFPMTRVYGPTAGPELRLVTCGGPFDYQTRSYLDNIVVYARLAGSYLPSRVLPARNARNASNARNAGN